MTWGKKSNDPKGPPFPIRDETGKHPPLPPCRAYATMNDGSVATCEGVRGHFGPHHASMIVTWESEEEAKANGRI